MKKRRGKQPVKPNEDEAMKERLIYLKGMQLDYQGGLQGKGFVFVNPNAKSVCGCGESFSLT